MEGTGRTDDGGIDGKGIVRIGGFLDFHMLLQCISRKNYCQMSNRLVGPHGRMHVRTTLQVKAETGVRTEMLVGARRGSPPSSVAMLYVTGAGGAASEMMHVSRKSFAFIRVFANLNSGLEKFKLQKLV